MGASDEFGRRAVSRIRTDGGERPVGLGGSGVDTTRVFSYAEYDAQLVVANGTSGLVSSSAPGSSYLYHESGYHGSTLAGRTSSMLQAFRLPNSSHVDRTLCAEFKVLGD